MMTMKRCFLVMFVCMLACSAQVFAAYGDVHAYWEFNDTTPGNQLPLSTLIQDSSGNARHLSQVQYGSAGTFYFDSGNIWYGNSSAIEMYVGQDLSEDMVLVHKPSVSGTSIQVPYSDGITFEALVRVDPNTDVDPGLLQLERVDEREFWWRLEADDGHQLFYWRCRKATGGGYGVSVAGSANIMDGQWHHLAVVKSYPTGGGTELKLYVDYVEDGNTLNTNYYDNYDTTADLYVGSYKDSITRDFAGEIDFIKISEGALNVADMVQPLDVPENPNPADEATVVPITSMLSWTPIDDGSTIISQTVQLSTDPNLATIEQTLDGSGNTADPSLAKETTYYWRVVTELSGQDDRVGNIWSFTTPMCVLEQQDGNLNDDCIVDFKDFAIMAENWLESVYEGD